VAAFSSRWPRLAGKGITVNAVAPGHRTEMVEHFRRVRNSSSTDPPEALRAGRGSGAP
jgi:NAD(P)-dependent dehydrogenase (short-subunit alcohol dehydrogenase family)